MDLNIVTGRGRVADMMGRRRITQGHPGLGIEFGFNFRFPGKLSKDFR
jgi:hypothetical protein